MGKTNDAGAARREERIAVGQLQLRQSPPPGGLRFDLAGLRQPASRATASAISGISGVGEKPSSAGARTAQASVGRAVGRLRNPLSCIALAMIGCQTKMTSAQARSAHAGLFLIQSRIVERSITPPSGLTMRRT